MQGKEDQLFLFFYVGMTLRDMELVNHINGVENLQNIVENCGRRSCIFNKKKKKKKDAYHQDFASRLSHNFKVSLMTG